MEAEIQDSKEQPKGQQDKYLWAIFLTLLCVSVVELYSASSREVVGDNVFSPIIRHGMMLGVGVLIVFIMSRIHFSKFIYVIPIFALGSLLMMGYVLFFGEIINGARRSFNLFGIAIQPSEFLKLSAVLIIAVIMSRTQLSKKDKTRKNGVIATASVVFIMGALLFSQGLTNTILLMAISLSMMVVGGIQFKKLGAVILVYSIVAIGGWYYKDKRAEIRQEQATELAIQRGTALPSQEDNFRGKTWKERFKRFFDPTPKYEMTMDSKNQQEMFSYMAQANGGIVGVWPGNSRETSRLPLAFSDYIFAIVIEDLGFVGGFALLLLYLSLIARAGTIAARCSNALPALLVMGCAVMIIFQALFHMAIVTGVFPVSGQPLPLISKGGTSILITSIAFGIMLSVSRFAVQSGKKQEIKEEGNSLPEEMRAINPTQLS
ncbi:MAG: FtsW/RodA/SpoVE family cell cycle protein [Muribaculaceae bacterium]|nr:FtsW/RodA/SpoVE family cell cycle protein [Muribaculaceae bacterium]